MGITMVKLNDLEVVDEYRLTGMPALVYFRRAAPITFEGDLTRQADVLQWLVHNRNTAEEEDVIEEISEEALHAMIASVEHLAVLFCKSNT